MQKPIIAALLASSLLGACALQPEMKMVPAADAAIGVRFAQGDAAMVSPGRFGVVELLPVRYNGGSGEIIFKVAAYNKFNDSINFGAEDVAIHLDDGTAIPVQDFDSRRHDAKTRANMERVLAITYAAARAWDAERVSRHNPRLADSLFQEDADQLGDNMAAIDSQLAYAIAHLSTMLQTTTIDPGTAWGGAVVANQPSLGGVARRIDVTVTFVGERHDFKLLVAPEGTPTPVRDLPAVTHGGMAGLFATPPTWLWNAPPVAAEDDATYTASRF
jgi:hypothetical protein